MPAFLETLRRTVTPDDCDYLGHMNIQHYFRAVSDGMMEMMARLGLTVEEIHRRRIAFVAVGCQAEFHHELRAGDVIALETGVLEIGQKFAIFNHRLTNASTREVAMSAKLKCALLHLENRRAIVIPEDIRTAAAKWLLETGS